MCCGKEEGTRKHSDQTLCLNVKVFWAFILFYFILFESEMLDDEVKWCLRYAILLSVSYF